MYLVSSEQVIGSYAVRYKTLTNLINNEYAGCVSNVINIFVDLTSILRAITCQPITCNGTYSIAASIINLCAHYRNFFKEYYGVYARFFIIASEVNNRSMNAKFVPTYNRYYHGNNQSINTIVDGALSILDLLTPYINDIGFYQTDYEFGVFVQDIMHYENTPTPGLIISKDPYIYQMARDDAFACKILRPRKENNEDISYIINQRNAVSAACLARKVVNPDTVQLNSSLLSLVYALSRVPERSVPSIHQMPLTIKALGNATCSRKMLNDRTTDIEYVCDILKENGWLKISDPILIRARFNAIDIETQYNVFRYDASATKYTGMVNLYDPNAVKEISVRYFKDCPLDLNVL